MSYAFGVAALILGLLASIALHEYGHLVVARWARVKVSDFMVGFGPRVWGRKIGETEFGLRLIPLGGYIRMIGMYPPHSKLGVDEHANLGPADRARVFHAIHPGKKIAVMVAGPAMNLLLGVLLITMAGMGIGLPGPTPEISRLSSCGEVRDECVETPAQKMGLLPGDRVVAIAGSGVLDWPGLVDAIDRSAGRDVEVRVLRGDSEVRLSGEIGKVGEAGFLGIVPATSYQRVGPADVAGIVSSTVDRTVNAIAGFPARLVELTGVVLRGQPRDPSGPIGVVGLARISGEVAESSADWRVAVLDILLLLAGLNISLFVFNLIPLVPLDGGNALTAMFELVRRSYARVRGRVVPPAVDGAKLLPLTYSVAIFLLAMAVLVTLADIVEPLRLV
jgi:membrane-associated protease RseP (regulator of RpoE activity)